MTVYRNLGAAMSLGRHCPPPPPPQPPWFLHHVHELPPLLPPKQTRGLMHNQYHHSYNYVYVQVVAEFLLIVFFFPPPHFCLSTQPLLWLVLLMGDHPQLTLGQEMVKSSLTMPHTASPYKWNGRMLGFRIVDIVAY